MADTNLGGVYYEVSAETEALIKAEQQVYKSTEAMAKDFAKVDKDLQNLAATISSAGLTVNKFGKVVDAAGNENKQLSETLATLSAAHQRMGSTVQGASAQLSRINKTSAAVSAGLGGMGRQAGMAGIQIQQFVGQIQGGQSAIVALSQQSADLGFALGAPLLGAVVSIAAAVGGILYNSMQDGAETVEELTEKLIKLKEESGLTANQAKLLSEQEKDSLESKYATIKALEDEIRAIEKRAEIMSSAGVGLDAGQFAIPRSAEENIQRYAASLEEARRTIIKNRAEIDLLNAEIDKSKQNIGEYEQGAVAAAEKQKLIADTTRELNQQLELARVKQEQGELAAAKLAVAYKLGLESAALIPDELAKTLELTYKIKEAQELADKEQKERLAAAEQRQREAQGDIEKGILDSERRIAAEKAKIESAARSGIGLTRLQQLAQQYEQEKQLLLAAQNAKIESEIAYEERLKELKLQYANDVAAEQKRIQEQQKSDTQKSLEAAGFSYEQLSSQAIGTFAAIASGAQSGTDAIRALAQSILTQAIGALIKMAITSIIGQKTAESAGSATAATLASAYAPAAAAASLASFGANAAPAAAGITSTYALTAGLSAAGGRLYGGPVSAGSIYPITENGKPEILQQGNRQYLLPGSGGRVISNKDMMPGSGGSGVNVTVNVNNSSGASVDVQRRQGADRSEIIDIVVADIQGRGRVQRAITSTTTASNKV